VYYVGADDGVYISRKQGTNWTRLGNGLPHAQVVELDRSQSLGILAAGTHGRGLFELAPPTQPLVKPPSDQTAVEGASQAFSLGSFVDPDGSPGMVDVNWGDATADTTFRLSMAGSLGTQSHTFGGEGAFTVTVTVTDSTGLSGSATFKVTVSDPAVVQASAIT